MEEDALCAPPPLEAAEPLRRLLHDTSYPQIASSTMAGGQLPEGVAGVLLRLFAIEIAVPAAEAACCDLLVSAGLVGEEEGWLIPRASARVVDGLVVLGDPVRCSQQPEFVAPVSPTSTTAAALTVRRSVSLGLDLCTGSGVLALLLARHCRRVVATDLAPRALAWAAFNAALNDAELDLRQGSLVDPVLGERFDVVSANPPYVVGLDGDLIYRESPMPGDGVSEVVVRALPDLLVPGGWATTTLSWTGADGARPRSWIGNRDVQAWLLTTRRAGVKEHALAWVGSHGGARDRAERVARWSAALIAAGTRDVCEGALVLHAGPRGWREDDAPRPASQSQGERLVRAFEERRAAVDDSSVLALSSDVQLCDDGTRVVRWDGALSDLDVDPHTARLLLAADGGRPLGSLVVESAAATGAPAERVRGLISELQDAGVLVPARPDGHVVRDRTTPPPTLTADQGRELGAALLQAGYHATGVAGILGTTPTQLVRSRDLPVYPLRTPATGLGALVRLLLLGLPVGAGDLPDGLAGQLAAAGFADADAARLVPVAQLVPQGRLLIASDLTAARDRPDVVVGVQPPSATLAELTPRRPVARALDVGTGCGLQAVLLAEHAQHVVATDVNPRALAYAAVNAALAGVQVELRQGSWFGPVEGERFDLVVTNPPYVLSPDSRWTFRDAGLPRDDASRLVAQRMPKHLCDRGIGVALLSWIDVPEELPAPLMWSSQQGCDAVLLATGTADPWETATAWNSDQRDPAAYAAEVERWLAWMSAEGITAVEYGALVLRRTGGQSARRIGLPGRPDGPAGEQVLRLLEDVAVTPESVLLPAPDSVLEQHVRAAEAGWTAASGTLRQAGGLGLSTFLDPPLARVLSRLEPGRTVREAAGDQLAVVLPELARLAAVGLLVPG